MEMPGFMSPDYDKTLSICTLVFPEEWMGKAFSVAWFLVFGGIPTPLMAVLYSQRCTICGLWGTIKSKFPVNNRYGQRLLTSYFINIFDFFFSFFFFSCKWYYSVRYKYC